MAICHTVTEFVQQKVIDAVENWVEQQEETCNNYPWPVNWLCKFTTILVKVITYVTKYIIVPVNKTICIAITGSTYVVLSPFIVAFPKIDDPIKKWLWTRPKIEYSGRTSKGEYRFRCNCKDGEEFITVEAENDEEAKNLAVEECEKVCQ
jgi:hypothetical protein